MAGAYCHPLYLTPLSTQWLLVISFPSLLTMLSLHSVTTIHIPCCLSKGNIIRLNLPDPISPRSPPRPLQASTSRCNDSNGDALVSATSRTAQVRPESRLLNNQVRSLRVTPVINELQPLARALLVPVILSPCRDRGRRGCEIWIGSFSLACLHVVIIVYARVEYCAWR